MRRILVWLNMVITFCVVALLDLSCFAVVIIMTINCNYIDLRLNCCSGGDIKRVKENIYWREAGVLEIITCKVYIWP